MFLIFLFSVQTDLEPSVYKILEYTEKKKEPAVAFLLSTAIPSAGHFYAHKPIWGLGFAVGEIILFERMINAENNDILDDENVWYLVLSFAKIAEILHAMNSTDNYNREIKEELGLKTSVNLHPKKIGLNIGYRFR